MTDYPDLVIFDCDGTLVDTERISVRVNLRLLQEAGSDYTEADIHEHLVGASYETYLAKVEAHLGRPLEPDWIDRWGQEFRDACATELEAVDGVAEAIVEILEAGSPICVASNSAHDDINRNLEHTDLLRHFDGKIFSASDVAVGKPSPELFLHAAASFGIDPSRCIVIEDSPVGVAAARAAGMRVYAYAGGVITEERLVGPDTHVFHDMRELPELIRRTW
ncbi:MULTISPECIES: HAD family hydrolase [unclassified Plantibacter]|uniref:HAD family hydrolase n=1 Tax=unclassified Plantibacter TaxID=2624265 RepID=UPI003D356A31